MTPNTNGIGKPGMIGVGPGANLRQKAFQSMQKEFLKAYNWLHGHQKPTLQDVKNYLHILKTNDGDIKKYCSVPGTQAYHASYVNALTAAGILEKALGKTDPKLDDIKREVPRLTKDLHVLATAAYVAQPVVPVTAAHAAVPPPPMRSAPPTPSAAPPRPTSSPTGKV